ncbi:hypothetical protein PFISCL1PPCAC_5422 [Pristionchus fissidentatus]|uniref:Uncharacterized protein n=1 Tax=Pristionchus fissidentatus TaxID=1538716 RepID=A0AAV5V6G6_9BILA|nr:hypothetical protein PFISCL1PPCAC_5422 [Pristionchus fissidentatus]
MQLISRDRACSNATPRKEESGTSDGPGLAATANSGEQADRSIRFAHSSSTATCLLEGVSSPGVGYTEGEESRWRRKREE